MPRETSDFSVSEQKLGGLTLGAPHNASDAPKPPLFVAADIKSGVFRGNVAPRENTAALKGSHLACRAIPAINRLCLGAARG